MYWRIGSAYYKRPREKNKAAFREIVKRGPPPGLLAFDGVGLFLVQKVPVDEPSAGAGLRAMDPAIPLSMSLSATPSERRESS